jgi:hypothetical protein
VILFIIFILVIKNCCWNDVFGPVQLAHFNSKDRVNPLINSTGTQNLVGADVGFTHGCRCNFSPNFFLWVRFSIHLIRSIIIARRDAVWWWHSCEGRLTPSTNTTIMLSGRSVLLIQYDWLLVNRGENKGEKRSRGAGDGAATANEQRADSGTFQMHYRQAN